ncbi:subtilisin inhibitor-like [Vicia villosa]|uniref:subtilisin inhibitor-like n=1 Tax=Vicia villosa TaxID=3911 RepID=UPI00273B324F|nr:subtilisin inhibitor-like [Vicia villosa]
MAEEKQQGTKSTNPSLEQPSSAKTSWPELVGVTADEAEKKIKEEMPEARIQVVPPNTPVTYDYRLDRVRLFVDESSKVIETPTIG